MKQFIFYIKILVTYLLFVTPSYTEIVDKITFVGNERISKETIKMFAGVDINDDISDNKLNLILKDLYATGFLKILIFHLKKIYLIFLLKNYQ
jgi:outer membrane protein assembly factor BamA